MGNVKWEMWSACVRGASRGPAMDARAIACATTSAITFAISDFPFPSAPNAACLALTVRNVHSSEHVHSRMVEEGEGHLGWLV